MTVSAIIPAYNEENTVGNVINAVKRVDGISEIIVVSDGSRDRTASIAKKSGANVIELYKNMGKGAAIKAGLDFCKGNIVLFLDADLIGLNDSHVLKLLQPVMNNEAEMSVGIFHNGRLSTDLAQKISPYLSGQRAVKKEILDNIHNLDIVGFGIEIALTRFAVRHGIRVKEVHLEDLTHLMKEEKLGLARGLSQRMKMYWEIYKGFRLVKR